MKIVTVIGARPQFVKAAVVSRLLAQEERAREIIVPTGQHYDANMSAVFFEELENPVPEESLGIRSRAAGQANGVDRLDQRHRLHGFDIARPRRTAADIRRRGERCLAEEDGDARAHAHIFRLPGIYGAGRNALEMVREGKARRIEKPGQVLSRIHVRDLGSVLTASMDKPNPGAIYIVCDDEPAPQHAVIAYAATLLGMAPPPLVPFDDIAAEMTPMARSFYAESKRVRNDRIKQELGVTLEFPTYREGLAAIHARMTA